ncbi:hypothetical protein ACIPMU_17605 [Streptomyces cyaneofuscatus]|uniref:hypothetical protein n=1 Tax=Streptomyces cyaneofuscatus TaxID=66883 RepID=UPI003803FCF2
MHDYALTADVPLGPFEGTLVTVRSAKGRNAKLHGSMRCSQLRTRDVVVTQVPLNASVVGRMCVRCAESGSWGRPTTGLGIFLRALCGVGLLYELQSHVAPDEDDAPDEEVRAAAQLLLSPSADADEVDEEGEAREAAEWLREAVFSNWRAAAKSLHLAATVAADFPWLEGWAEPKFAAKRQRLEALRAQAALFVDPEGLALAAAVAGMSEPEMPVGGETFTALGNGREVDQKLRALWHSWQSAAQADWEGPEARSHISYGPVSGIRSNRTGYDRAREGAQELVDSWEEQARAAAESAASGPEQLLTLRLPPVRAESVYRRDGGFVDELDEWTIGALVTCFLEANWADRTVTLRVPAPLAARLAADGDLVDVGDSAAEYGNSSSVTGPSSELRALQPGIFDDGPVFDRLPVAQDHLRVLRSALPHSDEFHVVFSPDGGVEVLLVTAIEKRLADGWQGVIVAGVSDLPAKVIELWCEEVGPRPASGEGMWPERVGEPQDPRFGWELSLADGARMAAWTVYEDRNRERNLRLLAMARGVPDLRALDGGRDGDGHTRGLPLAVWQGLLAGALPDLQPFRKPSADRWRGGSDIPLGPLSDVQVYASNADPRYEGKGHSPLCRHTRERGVVDDDDLLTVTDLVVRDDFDWCSKCGGYAMRRLTDLQLSYYRAAHRLHDIAEQLDSTRGGYGRPDLDVVGPRLSELAQWRPTGEKHWYSQDAQEWRAAVSEVRRKAESAGRG